MYASAYYAWIVEGLALFDALATHDVEVIEVFPTASWTRWQGKRSSQTRAAWSRQGLAALGLDGVPPRTNLDQKDAIAATVTARQYTLGLTETLDAIVVPAGRLRGGEPTSAWVNTQLVCAAGRNRVLGGGQPRRGTGGDRTCAHVPDGTQRLAG